MSRRRPPVNPRILPPFATPFEPPRSARNEKNRSQGPLVTVFGAGIAGLSTAHELIERGFSVQVVEPARSPDEEYAVEAGGMARNQFGRIPEDPRILHGPEPVTQRPVDWQYTVFFQPGGYVIADEPGLKKALADLVTKLAARDDELAAAEADRPLDWLLMVRGHGDPSEGDPMGSSRERVHAVVQFIHNLADSKLTTCRFRECPLGDTLMLGPRSDPANFRVELALENPLTAFREEIEKIWTIRPSEMNKVQPRFPTPERILFDIGGSVALDPGMRDDWNVPNETKLVSVWQTLKRAYLVYKNDFEQNLDRTRRVLQERFAQPCDRDWKSREILFVEVRGHTDGDGEEALNRKISRQRAQAVINRLKFFNNWSFDRGPINPGDFDLHFRAVGVGSAEPIGDQRSIIWRRRSNRVEIRIVERLIPGEHGYRFFPAFYRHLFDTMRRTPLLDERFEETGSTAYDSLEPVTDAGIAVEDGQDHAILETRPVRSLEELRRLSELFFRRLGVTQRDIVRFQTRLLKFLTSSSIRRKQEYEKESWWRFIGGDSERGYSPRMAEYLKETPQALIAMNAEETDARSQGNIVCQLQLHYLKNQFDRSLNGPTTRVWIRQWKRYLKRQGVRFFVGELGKLEWCRNELIPVTTCLSAWLEEPPARESAPEAPPSPPVISAIGVKVAPNLPAAPAPAPSRPSILVEVLDNDDGEYAILIAGKPYCFTARGHSREDIAECLARAVNQRDPDVIAEVVSGTPGDPEAWPRGRTRIKLWHRMPDDGAVKIGGDICDADKLVVTYSDGPTPKERPVREVKFDAFAPVRASRDNAYRIVNDSSYAVEVLEDWERTRNKTNSGTKARQLLAALAKEVLNPPSPKAPPRAAKGKASSGRSSLEDTLNELLETETRNEARAAVMHFVNERFIRDVNTTVSLVPPDCQPELRKLLADLIWAAHSPSQVETRVQRFLEEREPMRHLRSNDLASIHHFGGRLARTQDNELSFLHEVVLDSGEWVMAGILRMAFDDFAQLLLKIEERQQSLRPLAPKIDVRSSRGDLDIRFLPPDPLLPSNDPCAGKSYMHILKAIPFGNDLQITDSSGAPITTSSPWILDHRYTWIVVRNADENLRIITEPTPENPDEDYQSHEEDRAAFRPDFYVLALPFDQASTLVWRAEQERPGGVDGCLSELLDFDRNAYRRNLRGKEIRLIRDPHGRPPKLYPLRDFSGIQYYFHNQVRIGRGHLYFPQAEWGLSSISQLAYWRERMSPTSPFLGQLSVDIGAFYRPAERLGSGRIRPSAWHSTTTEIAEEVWRQVRESMDFLRASVLAPPDYFHLDQWLRFDDRRGSSFRNNAYIRITSGFPKKCDPVAPGLIEHGLLDWRSSIDVPIPPGRMDEPWGDYVVWVNGEPFTVRVSRKDKDSYELCSYEYSGGERRLRQCTTYPRNGLLPVDDAKSQHLGDFTNQTTAANSSNPGDVIAFEDTAGKDDAFYIGFGKQFSRLVVDRVGGKKGTGTATTVWEYSRGGGSWKLLPNITDPTAGGSAFGTAPLKNGERVTWDLPFDWKPVRVRDGPPLYYVRVRVDTGTYTQGPTLSRLSTDGFVSDSATLRHRIACHLAALINNSPCGSLHAGVYQEFRIITNPCHPDFDACAIERREIGCPATQLEVCSPGASGATPFHTEVDDKAPILLYVQSKVPTNGALICVEGSSPGNYEIWIGEKRFCYAQTSVVIDTRYARKGIRDGLFTHLSCHSDIPVIPELSGDTGIVLLPKASKELPQIRVHNENQHLDLIFGDMLHIRLEQCHQHLSFEDPEKATIGYNLTPFLINVPNQWQYRPGVRPSGGRMSMTVPVTHASQTDIFYRVSNQRWVGAGTYMATTTRLTTMEAANESARHAVNAILHTLVQPGTIYNSQGKMLAEFAEIWDPERFELDDLEPLKRLDEKLANEGLPHVLDILKLIEAVDAIPMHGKATDDPLSNITHLLQHASEDFNKDWGFSLEALYGILGKAAEQANNLFDPLGILRGTGGGLKGLPADLVERIQRALRAFMEGAGGNPSGGARS